LLRANTHLKITAICVVIPLEEGFDSNRNEIRWVFDSKGGLYDKEVSLKYDIFVSAMLLRILRMWFQRKRV